MKKPPGGAAMNYIISLLILGTSFIPLHNTGFGTVGRIFLGIAWLIFYIAEPFAFNYKVKLSKVRVLWSLTGGDPEGTGDHAKIGNIVWFAFLIRLVFRVLILIIAFSILGVVHDGSGLPTWLLWVYIIAVTCELFIFMWPLMTFNLSENTEKGNKAAKQEREWRRQNFPMLKAPDTLFKEFVSDILLSIYSLVAIRTFWNMINNTFSSYIISSAKEGSGPVETAIMVIIPVLILSAIFLIPVRLAYWIGESIRSRTASQKRHFYLSLLVAAMIIMLPTIRTFFRVFLV
jgi:hypothetical protein